ncbi:MAG: DUF4190 domain-containing protein [Planctomycetota bacterium]|jgi:hypothetical protein
MSEAGNKADAKKSKTNWFAVSSFVLSIPGFCTNGLTSILSLIIGIIALIRIKKSLVLIRGRNFAVAGIVISIVVLLFVSWNALPTVKAKKTLTNGRLANLPQSVTNLKVGGWAGLFTGEDFIKFRATPEDINKFVAESPSIKEVAPEMFNSENMHLPEPDNSQKTSDYYTLDHKHYDESNYPSWYRPTMKVKGRRYLIPPDGYHNWGSVIINDETNTVYISVIWS